MGSQRDAAAEGMDITYHGQKRLGLSQASATARVGVLTVHEAEADQPHPLPAPPVTGKLFIHLPPEASTVLPQAGVSGCCNTVSGTGFSAGLCIQKAGKGSELQEQSKVWKTNLAVTGRSSMFSLVWIKKTEGCGL